jgi:gas vesicle protein
MAQGTGELRQEIEQTRARVGSEVEALSYKTDIGGRLDDYVEEKKEAVTSKVVGAKDAVTGAVGTVVPDRRRIRRAAQSVGRTAQRNPVGLAVGGAAVGFVAGLLIPSTHVEDERLGELSTKVKDAAVETGHEALERGKDVAQSAIETVREEGMEQTRELASDLKERVQPETEPGRTPTT